MNLTIARLTGDEMRARLDDLARLRIAVFRAWPYLYKGTMVHERQYLPRYAEARTGTLIVAQDGEAIVGASTALGLDEESDYVREPFEKAGMDLSRIFYFGESVLLPQYRGQGVGVRFFEERERTGREHGYEQAAFCGVVRPDDHPARPADYQPLDTFWGQRGYTRRPDLVATFSWKDIGDAEETDKSMIYWMKTL
jgi:GNAT superfamily N-acetyltransferase